MEVEIITPAQQRINQLEVENMRLAWNRKFGCYNSSGFEVRKWPEIQATARWIVYFDINGMKQLNDTHGKPAVDAKIYQVLGVVRSTDHVYAGQRYSGDEFIVVICEDPGGCVGDPEGLVHRLTKELEAVGMSATFAWSEVKSTDLDENVEPAETRVDELKAQRGVGR